MGKDKLTLGDEIRERTLGGELRDYETDWAGIYSSYYISLRKEDGFYIVKINAASEEDPFNDELRHYLRDNKEQFRLVEEIKVDKYSLELSIKPAFVKSHLPERLAEAVDPVIDHLLANNYRTCCERCGRNYVPADHYMKDGRSIFICSSCAARERQENSWQFQKLQQQKSKLSFGAKTLLVGLLTGIVGSLSLLGRRRRW
ncbi:MAG: hypothetical protein IJM08_08080 [Firmicutes bacterium]|nr:hypothetical protein [Bacillota bacterium]